MTLVLIGLSAFCVGWFVRDLALVGLGVLDRVKQEQRLKKMIGSVKPGIPLQTFLSFLEKNSLFLLDKELFKIYLVYLSRQLLRMNRSDVTPVQIFGYQILFSLGGALFFGFLSGTFELAVIAFFLGGTLPLFWLRDMALKREKKLLRELPNALEILSLCSEAGLTLEQGMDQYFKNSKPGPLKDEFSGILEQTRSGSSRKNALEAVASRLQLTDFSLFSGSLIQAEKFGTGISKTLRQLSLTMRDKQYQRAEKAVQEMPVKMLIPLILFIMPVTFLIIFGPILLQFLKP